MIVILHHSKAKSLRVTSKTIQQQEAIKSTSEKDCDFLNKLSKGNKTKLPIELSNIPFNPSFMISAQSLLSEENNKLGIEIYK